MERDLFFFFFSFLRWASCCSVMDLEMHVLIVDCLVLIYYDVPPPSLCDSPAIW